MNTCLQEKQTNKKQHQKTKNKETSRNQTKQKTQNKTTTKKKTRQKGQSTKHIHGSYFRIEIILLN